MAKIAIFDSGFGSLSLIRPIQKVTKSEIIYFADKKNFPYGKKSKSQLRHIIDDTIKMLKENFNPDLIVIGSNTPSLLLQKKNTLKIIGVLPPIKEAAKISKTSNIAILATESVVHSYELSNYIKLKKEKKLKIKKINASALVDLVESGKFIDNNEYCKKIIRIVLNDIFDKNNIDVVTLSSTHLSLLVSILKKEFPNVIFLDPAKTIANKVAKITQKNRSKRNSIKIFTSSDPKIFQKHLYKVGFKHDVNFLSS